jgi:hypothetical protein
LLIVWLINKIPIVTVVIVVYCVHLNTRGAIGVESGLWGANSLLIGVSDCIQNMVGTYVKASFVQALGYLGIERFHGIRLVSGSREPKVINAYT